MVEVIVLVTAIVNLVTAVIGLVTKISLDKHKKKDPYRSGGTKESR